MNNSDRLYISLVVLIVASLTGITNIVYSYGEEFGTACHCRVYFYCAVMGWWGGWVMGFVLCRLVRICCV